MPEIQLPNFRRYSDVHFRLSIDDNGIPLSWDSVTIKKLFMYSEKQRGFGGKCSFQVNEDPHYLDVTFHAYNQQFLGIHRVVVQVELEDDVNTYDARVGNMVASTSNEPVIYDGVLDVPIHVSAVDTTVLYEILAACRLATSEATDAADRADGVFERMSGGRKDEVLTKLSNSPLDIGWKPVQGTGGSRPYISLERKRRYLYRVTFDSLPEHSTNSAPVGGGCSAYVANGKLYRNYDFNYDSAASFVVRTKDFEGMSMITGLNDGQMDDELIAQLPYRVVDGRNNNGIMLSVHLLFNDWQYTGAGGKSIPLTRLPFEVLTRVKSMDTIAADLNGVLDNLAVTEVMGHYLLQLLVTDGETTYAVIPPVSDSQSYELVDATSFPKMSNFRYVAREEVSRFDMDLQARPTGIERFNLMPCPLEDLRFTKAYENPDRLSEFIGIDGTTKASSDAELLALYQLARAEYLDRERDGQTWQTMHSVVYGNRMESLFIQEDWEDDVVAANGVSYIDAKIATETARAQAAENALDTNKVDKVLGKGLSTNDFSTSEKQKLAALENYDDTPITGRVTALEGLTDKVVLNGMTASEDGSTVKLSLAKINIKTGTTASVDVPLPVVDANGAGILNPQTYQTIINNQILINAIIGASVAVSGLAAEPTQAQVTNAWLTASGLDELVNGARLFDVTNTKVWTYYTNTEIWYPVEAEGGGSVVIAQWTNSALGTVKGVTDNASHTNDGKLTAETDGTGSVLGWDRLVARVQTTLSKVTALEREVGDKVDKANIATTINSQSVNTDVAGAAAVYAAATTPIVAGEQTAVTVAMDCGKKYKYMDASGIASLAFTFNAPTDNAVATNWYLKFRSGATPTSVSWPANIYFPTDDGLAPDIEANTIYEMMIDEDYCLTVQTYKTT